MTVCTFLLVFVPGEVSAGVGTLAERTGLRKQRWQCGPGTQGGRRMHIGGALRPQATAHRTEALRLPPGLHGK